MDMTSPKRKNGSTVVRLVVSFRKEGKVKNRIIKVIGQSKDPKTIEEYKKTAKDLIDKHKKGLISFSQVSEKQNIDLYRFLGEDRYNTGFDDIFGASYEELGFRTLIRSGRDNRVLNEVLRCLVLMRVFQPSSKLRSCHLLKECFNKSVSYKQVLWMMDHLSSREEEIRGRVFELVQRVGSPMKVLLFDVTTLFFESVSVDDLRDFGYSKDGKFNEVQLVLAVLSNQQGLPVAYEVFPGHTAETKTLQLVMNRALKRYQVNSVCVVADRGMFSDNNFAFFEDLKEQQQICAEYVVSCPLKKLPKEFKDRIFDFKKRQKEGLGGKKGVVYYEFSYRGRRFIVSYSEKLRVRDEKKRQKILDKLLKLSSKGSVPASQLIKNTGVRKYLKTLKGRVQIDHDKILRESLWDGLYGICTNKEKESGEQLFGSYRSLWKIEELFRINKHTLRMRPIYHRLSRRIRAHLLICFLAYTVLRHTEIVLKNKGLDLSPHELIETLKNVESFIIRDKLKKDSVSYCIPRRLSEQAQQIYKVFNKKYPQKPYPLETTSNKKK